MASCERCWVEATRRGIEYRDMLRIAEIECHPCCEPLNGEILTLSENARRLRAGQFWDEETKSDSREHRSASPSPLAVPPDDSSQDYAHDT